MTDNPSGSTGQNVTAPANAPAGSDSSAHTDPSDPRKVLFPIIRDMMRVARLPGDITDAIIAAGFTRAHHDGERVVALEREIAAITTSPAYADKTAARERDALRAERDALAAKLAEAEHELAEYAKASDYADDAFAGMTKMRDAAIRERDEARAALEKQLSVQRACFERSDAGVRVCWGLHDKNAPAAATDLSEHVAVLRGAMRWMRKEVNELSLRGEPSSAASLLTDYADRALEAIQAALAAAASAERGE